MSSFYERSTDKEREAFREHEKRLEIAANVNGYSLNDIGTTNEFWERRRKAAGDLRTLKNKLCDK